MKYGYSYHPQPNLHKYNLHKYQPNKQLTVYIARNSKNQHLEKLHILHNNTLTKYISPTTTLQQITYPQQEYFNKLHIRNNKLNINQSQVPQKGNQKISKIRYQVH